MNPKGNVFKDHKLVIITIVSLVAVVGIGIGVFYYLSEQSIAQNRADHIAHMKKLDAQHEQLKKELAERKAAEEAAAKKAAEEKAKKEAEKKAAASKTSTKAPKAKNCKANDAHSDPNTIAIVVNKKRCFSPLSFTPSDLTTGYDGSTISSKAASSLAKMAKALNKYTKAKDGSTLGVTSSYRSYSNQVSTYNYWVNVNGSAASADKVSARPGYSEHQTGLAIDLAANNYGKNKKKCVLECFAKTKQYSWLQKHAAEYGFIERYPKGLTSITGYSPEAWHYRYVGVSVAQDMKAKGIKTLEQYWGLKGGDY